MMRFTRLLLIAAIAVAAGYVASGARPLDPGQTETLLGDTQRGQALFTAGGCASCHAAPEAKGEERLVLSGGLALASPFGTFVAPNISPDLVAGIGGWSTDEFASALLRGVSPEGRHYFPSFPYTSYSRMSLQDAVDLRSFILTLPASPKVAPPHDVPFPFNIRRSLAGWKWLNLEPDWITDFPEGSIEARGRYLVEGPGHCGECHTPRDIFGGLKLDQWLAGAPNPTGKGQIPALTPDKLTWEAGEIAYYLETGFTPEFDSAGGEMVKVIENTSALPESDRQAIAAYLKALPAN